MNRYSLDPGLHGETGFFYPEEWNENFDNWPSVLGLQAQDSMDYVAPEDLGKKHIWLTEGRESPHFVIFVNDDEELEAYLKNNPHISHPVIE